MSKKISVRYYTCNCEWVSKYCDEHHTEYVSVPVEDLMKYKED